MLLRYACRLVRGVSVRLLYKAATLWVLKGIRAVNAFKQRSERGELFPPFLFLALTDACNLHCRGCWIGSKGKARNLELEEIERLIEESKRRGSYFFTLLGGNRSCILAWGRSSNGTRNAISKSSRTASSWTMRTSSGFAGWGILPFW